MPLPLLVEPWTGSAASRCLKVRGGDGWLLRHRTLGHSWELPTEEAGSDIRGLYRSAVETVLIGDAQQLAQSLQSIWIGTTWERHCHDYCDVRNGITGGNAALVRPYYDRSVAFAPALYHTIKFGAFEVSWDSGQPPPSIASLAADAETGDTLLHLACRR